LDEVEIEGEDENSTEAWIEKCKLYSKLSRKTLQEEIGDWINELKEAIPSNKHNEINEFMSNSIMFEALSEELANDLISWRELKQLDSFPTIPTIVIGRDPKVSIKEMIVKEGLHKSEAKKIESIWQSLIRDQTKLNAKTKYILAKESGHSIHVNKPVFIKKAVSYILNDIQ